MCFRRYDPALDREAAIRIWRETGWARGDQEHAIDHVIAAGAARVAVVDGQAECVVTTARGTVRHGERDLPMACVTGAATSRVARRWGLARRLTAAAAAEEAASGALVAALGTFEQGFYDRLGFGTGGYEHFVSFDPARLRAGVRPRRPVRIGPDRFREVHENRLGRCRGHGSCTLDSPEFTRFEMLRSRNGFGLGYSDGGQAISHHVWCFAKEDVERGPYRVRWMAWRTPQQFAELLGVIRSLGDQVATVSMREPPGIQLQDLIDRPMSAQVASRGGEHEQGIRSLAYWQMRICDLAGCLERTALPGGEVVFNLKLTDPVQEYLPPETPWRGVAGEYVVTLGPESRSEPGRSGRLGTLEASVNAFTRLWMGVRPASGLAHTDTLCGPPGLLEALDRLIRLPPPRPDWDF
jgi:predicted acetyltransferase